MIHSSFILPGLAACALSLTSVNSAFANGSEILGPPNIAIASGSSVIAAGTGLNAQPGTIEFDVPADATVEQVLLYWEGAHHSDLTSADATIVVNGTEVTGTVIGGPTFFFTDPFNPPLGNVYYTSFRADITSLGLVAPGANVLEVEGLDNTFSNDGAGVLVVLQEDSAKEASITVRDGLDLAWWAFTGNLQVTEPQTFTFDAADVGRTANLTLFAGSVGQNRPNEIRINVDGQETVLVNELFNNNGPQWDTLSVPVEIPAGATSLTVEVISPPVNNALGGGASLAWVTAALTVPILEEPTNPGTGTPGYWKNHPEAWPFDTIELGGSIYTKRQAIALMKRPTAGDKTYNLVEHLIAAKLNVAIGNDSSCVAEAIDDADAFLAAHPVGSRVAARSAAWRSIAATFKTLGAYNEGKLCVPSRDD